MEIYFIIQQTSCTDLQQEKYLSLYELKTCAICVFLERQKIMSINFQLFMIVSKQFIRNLKMISKCFSFLGIHKMARSSLQEISLAQC